MTQLGMFDGTGPTLAREGMERVLDREDDWERATLQRIIPFLSTHPEYCADDLYRHDLMAWTPHHPNAIGALTRKLIESGYLERVGSIKSSRTQAQARRIVVYRSRVYRKLDP